MPSPALQSPIVRSSGSSDPSTAARCSRGAAPPVTTTPESRADTSDGASAWLRGSHSPGRNSPALVINPSSNNTSAAPSGNAVRELKRKLPVTA